MRDENAKPWDSAKLNKGIDTIFWTGCLFPEKILLPNDSGANLSAETESQEPLTLLLGVTRDCRQGVSGCFSSDASLLLFLPVKYVQ